MAWRYKQATGDLYHNEEWIAKGYAGKIPHQNKHSSQYIRDLGAIPVGRFEILPPFRHDKTGPFTMRLNPVAGTNLGGRDGFMIHGDSLTGPGNASNGCIILKKIYREKIWNSGDRLLWVEYP